MADFPPTGVKEDSAKFSDELENTAVANQMEGSYQYTRPRSTRLPRKTFTTGFTDLTQAQRNAIDDFWKAKQGASFTYADPTTGTVYTVTFRASAPLKWSYAGAGYTRRYDTSGVMLEQL